MKCPFCEFEESKVVDSRPTDEGVAIRRRRECMSCGRRFTTYEKIENIPLMVIKKDGSREMFDRTKISNGLIRACEKRPVNAQQLDDIVLFVENSAYNSLEREITTEKIGEIVMDKLKDLDEVAYVRFASVYRQFGDLETFMDELNRLLGQDIKKKKK